MKKGGIGGANTKTGLKFEARHDFGELLSRHPNYEVEGNKIRYKGQQLGLLLKKKRLYSEFLVPHGVPVKDLVSARLEPDTAVIIPSQKRATILEMKFQGTGGSVDEKLQTCAFKLQQYGKLFGHLGFTVKYVYVLGEWFMHPRYKDVLNYVTSVGCEHYFGELPLAALGLPE
jgi:hypothetical protein